MSIEKFKELEIISVGIMVDAQRVLSSVSVRGLKDGTQVLHFKQWLVPFDEMVQALGLNVANLENGQLELRAMGWITKIRPETLKVDTHNWG